MVQYHHNQRVDGLQAFPDTSQIGAYLRYLAVKKRIDDRALNPKVWQMLHRTLPAVAKDAPLKILEIGAGIGTMLVRAVERGLLTGPATYMATDRAPDQLRAARPYLSHWAEKQGHALSWSDKDQGRLQTANADVAVALEHASAETLAERSDLAGSFHLLIAHAVLDLIDFQALLPGLLPHLMPGGLALLTCNFDGDTNFLPECDADQEIVRRYHASMDARLAGASRTGRRLLAYLQQPDLEILAAGRSDWVIHPRDAGYSGDEAYFLHTIIETVAQELGKKSGDPPSGLTAWARERHRQVEAGELSFLARNLDLLFRRRHGRS